MTTACPPDDVLARYSAGTLDDSAALALGDHLGACAACLGRLDRLEARERPRRVPAASSVAPPALAGAVARVLGAGAPDPNAPPDVPGYRVAERVAQGGMGTVYRAVHVRLGKEVALKVIRGRAGPEAAARFEREARAAGRLDHPNVVRALDAGEVGGTPFLVMEFVPGRTLAQLVRAEGPLPLARACALARQVAAGLAAAHAAGIVHRDVKPSNVMLTPDGTAKLLDLGLAVLSGEADPPPGAPRERPSSAAGEPITEAGATLTHTGHALGTRDYMAPEQKAAPQSVGPAADVYGLGATLWFLLTGQPPAGSAPFAPTGAHGLPPEVWRGLLNPDPIDRFASAEAAGRALAPFARAPRRFGARHALGTALAVLAVACAAWLATGRAKPAPRERPPLPVLPFHASRATEMQTEWARATDLPARATGPHDLQFALVPPGELGLSMECRVRITKPFYLSTREVTVAQFRAFVAETKHVTSAVKTGRGGFLLVPDFKTGKGARVPNPKWNWEHTGHPEAGDAHPVCMVSWGDATAFCSWLGREYRLPTEAELTWAMRCGRTGEELILNEGDLGWYGDNSAQPRPVARFAANGWGLHDTFGNVAEWCADAAAPLPTGTFDDYAGPPPASTPRRVFLGYSHLTPAFKAKPLRDHGGADDSFGHVGFRVARNPTP